MRHRINGINLNVFETGNGPLTLVFLHYSGGSALEWQLVTNPLSAHYRCVALDMRGHGDSDAPTTDYSVDDMADDVADLLRVLNIRDFVLIGHSMSGKAALALASRQPTGLRSLLLLSPSPPLPEPIPEDERQTMLATHGQREAAEKIFRNITAKPVSVAAHEQIITDNLRTANVAWDAWLLEGSKEDISARMHRITVPVHILAGNDDRAVPPDVTKTMTLPYLKNATLETLGGAGHLLPWEVPDEVAAFIAKKVAR